MGQSASSRLHHKPPGRPPVVIPLQLTSPHPDDVSIGNCSSSISTHVSVGKDARPFRVTVDIGCSYLALYDKGHTHKHGRTHGYDPARMSVGTYRQTTQWKKLDFGGRYADGHVVYDRVRLGDVEYSQILVHAEKVKDASDISGVIGFGLPEDGAQGDPFWINACVLGTRDNWKQLFGLYIKRQDSGGSGDGSDDGDITIGGVNPERFKGEMQWTPILRPDIGAELEWQFVNGSSVLRQAPANQLRWEVRMAGTVVWNHGTPQRFGGGTARFDTRATHISGPEDTVDRIYQSIGAGRYTDASRPDGWYIPHLPTGVHVSFAFGDRSFPVDIEELFVWDPVLEEYRGLMTVSDDDRWTLGIRFLQCVYTAYGKHDGEWHVGIAELAEGSPGPPEDFPPGGTGQECVPDSSLCDTAEETPILPSTDRTSMDYTSSRNPLPHPLLDFIPRPRGNSVSVPVAVPCK